MGCSQQKAASARWGCRGHSWWRVHCCCKYRRRTHHRPQAAHLWHVQRISDKALLPKLVEPWQTLAGQRPAAVLNTAGLQLMDTCSTAIAEAMAGLAASDPALQRHLSFTPDTVEPSHSPHLETEIGFSGIKGAKVHMDLTEFGRRKLSSFT